MTSTPTTTNTPGYNCRIAIRFTSDKNGRKLAHYWSGNFYGRWIRIGLTNAETWIATDRADQA